MSRRIYLIVAFVFAALPLWSQANSGAKPAGEGGAIWSRAESAGDDSAEEEAPMIAPAPFTDEGFSLAFTSETPRTNYLRGGLSFGSVYDDNILPSTGDKISDVRYSVWPSISLEQSRSRLRWDLTYSPGFRFYQSHSPLNGTDHNLVLGLAYRLSPHVTLSLGESFQKTSDVLNLSDAGVVQGPTTSLVPPATTKISTLGDVALTYQFAPNEMIGVKAKASGLWYPDRANLNGLFDSTAVGSEVVYTHRLSGSHYIGVTYELQRLSTHPGRVQTQTQSVLFFYTVYLRPAWEVSVFAGPEHSVTHGAITFPVLTWSPDLGVSVGWHGGRTSLLMSVARQVSDGGGLSGAVRSNSADFSLRWRFARAFTSSLGAAYNANRVLDSLSSFEDGGHTWSATAALEHPLGERFTLQIGYTRLHQSYPFIAVISNSPDRNNAWVSFSYRFQRPFGR